MGWSIFAYPRNHVTERDLLPLNSESGIMESECLKNFRHMCLIPFQDNGHLPKVELKGQDLVWLLPGISLSMTANAFEEDKEKSFKTGMNAHITKPIDIKNYTCCFRSGAWNFIKPSQIKEIKNMDYGHLKKELPKKQE